MEINARKGSGLNGAIQLHLAPIFSGWLEFATNYTFMSETNGTQLDLEIIAGFLRPEDLGPPQGDQAHPIKVDETVDTTRYAIFKLLNLMSDVCT